MTTQVFQDLKLNALGIGRHDTISVAGLLAQESQIAARGGPSYWYLANSDKSTSVNSASNPKPTDLNERKSIFAAWAENEGDGPHILQFGHLHDGFFSLASSLIPAEPMVTMRIAASLGAGEAYCTTHPQPGTAN